MFGTSFDMMNSKIARSQTTKGIWCGKAADTDMLVLDVEGTDGREKEDQKAFEGKSALFCLALTDVMMVNMWMHEVGRFNAANLPLLKTVFEVHLRLHQGEVESKSRPLLLFILRDWDGSTPVESLQVCTSKCKPNSRYSFQKWKHHAVAAFLEPATDVFPWS
jgi:hypothetical protein